TPLFKEFGRETPVRCFISNVFCSLFAELKIRSVPIRFRPGTSGTLNALVLIDLQERAGSANDAHLTERETGGSERRPGTTSRLTDRLNVRRGRFDRTLCA